MLEQEDLAAAQRAWQAAKQAAREERARAAAEREADKRRIVSRFQLQAVPNGGSSGSGKGGKPPVQVWGSGGGGGGGENGGKARYRDGALVSQRGEKFIIEKARGAAAVHTVLHLPCRLLYRLARRACGEKGAGPADACLRSMHRRHASPRAFTASPALCPPRPLQGDEWDGGSRGKVFTKGKRGKGFV